MPATFRLCLALAIGLGSLAWPGRLPAAGTEVAGHAGDPIQPTGDLLEAGNAFGPLSLGDSRDLVRRKVALLPGASCIAEDCGRVKLELRGATMVAGLGFVDERLSKVMAVSAPHGPGEASEGVRRDWQALLGLARESHGAADSLEPRFPDLGTLTAPWGTHEWAKPDGSSVTLGIIPIEGEEGRAFSAILLVRVREPAAHAVPAAAAP